MGEKLQNNLNQSLISDNLQRYSETDILSALIAPFKPRIPMFGDDIERGLEPRNGSVRISGRFCRKNMVDLQIAQLVKSMRQECSYKILRIDITCSC